jgi:threonine/homoserine/homoserine lactone efflux protein
MIHLLGLGIMSSFVGALPLGMLNLTVLQLSLAHRQRQAILFSLGASIIEFLQIFFTFLMMNVLLKIPQLNSILALVSIPILLFLGYKNLKNSAPTEGSELTHKNAFLQGILLSFANVLVYPFWLLWGNLFVKNGWLLPDAFSYSVFAFGASLGTFGAFLAFILLGSVLWRHLQSVQKVTNRLIAFAFFGFAGFQIFNLFCKHIGTY